MLISSISMMSQITLQNLFKRVVNWAALQFCSTIGNLNISVLVISDKNLKNLLVALSDLVRIITEITTTGDGIITKLLWVKWIQTEWDFRQLHLLCKTFGTIFELNHKNFHVHEFMKNAYESEAFVQKSKSRRGTKFCFIEF